MSQEKTGPTRAAAAVQGDRPTSRVSSVNFVDRHQVPGAPDNLVRLHSTGSITVLLVTPFTLTVTGTLLPAATPSGTLNLVRARPV
jgi:hypothetical protein